VRQTGGALVSVSVDLLALFHWAHRFRFTLVDLGLKRPRTHCHPRLRAALAGTVIAAVLGIWPEACNRSLFPDTSEGRWWAARTALEAVFVPYPGFVPVT